MCGRILSSVDREHGGIQGAEFDHKDGDPSNGHISNWQLLCLTCHEAKTAIQMHGPIPADPEAWKQHAKFNPPSQTTEYPAQFRREA